MEAVAKQALFLTQSEREQILNGLRQEGSLLARFYTALQQRVYERVTDAPVAGDGLFGLETTTGTPTATWYYPAAEYLSDAAMLYALQPDVPLANWLRRVTLNLARTPVYDWVGPWFRNHDEPFTGHLETAHICWGISAVLGLAADAFTEAELGEVRAALAEKGVVLCRRWLAQNTHLANWRGILT